jgi:dihydrofolate synthase/folylpolyglutamate synthase
VNVDSRNCSGPLVETPRCGVQTSQRDVPTIPSPKFSYKEALAWLYSLQRFGIKLGLENTRRLIAELPRKGDPQIAHGGLEAAAPWKVIHVAGTNGKGSVCAMIDSICRAQGYRTGLFTSPHLVTFRERIRVNGAIISEEAVASGLTTIRSLIANWDPHPTFFEVTTALAIKYFTDSAGRGAEHCSGELPSPSPLPSVRGERITRRAGAERKRKLRSGSSNDGKIDIVILETGLGGRLDATNAVQSDVSAITPVDFDHEKWLGNTLAQIAGEKAGIIKPGVPVVSSPQKPEAEEVIHARALECGASLQFVREVYHGSPVALRGEYQKQNAAMAIATIKAANLHVDEKAIIRGLTTIEWPARFQRWDERVIIDGAHNPGAARILAQTWREVFGDRKATLILAVLSDKDLRGICEPLAPIADSVLLPKVRTERAAPPEELAGVLQHICRAGASPASNPESIRDCPTISIAESVSEALELARAKPNPILITGSLHFAGEVLAHLRGEPAAFEECAQ